MPNDKTTPNRGPQAQTAEAERKARLAAALRENLRRRKAQRRGREDALSPAPAEPDDRT